MYMYMYIHIYIYMYVYSVCVCVKFYECLICWYYSVSIILSLGSLYGTLVLLARPFRRLTKAEEDWMAPGTNYHPHLGTQNE